MLAKTISVAGISAEGTRGKMIFLALRVKPVVLLLQPLHEIVQRHGRSVRAANLLTYSGKRPTSS
jgi:hypothetical protein